MIRRVCLALLLLLPLASCGGSSSSSFEATGSPVFVPSVASATSTAVDFCAYLPKAGATLRELGKGTELPGRLIDALDAHQTAVQESAALASSKAKHNVLRASDALGQLKLAVAAAGTHYSTDRVVALRLKSAQLALLTAALASSCSP